MEQLKNDVGETLSSKQIELLIKQHIAQIKLPEIPPPQIIYQQPQPEVTQLAIPIPLVT